MSRRGARLQKVGNNILKELRQAKPFYLGFALYITFTFFYVHDAAPIIGQAGLGYLEISWYLCILFGVKALVLLLCALLSLRKRSVSSNALALSSSIFIAVGFSLSIVLLRMNLVSLDDGTFMFLLLGASILIGIGDGIMMLLWGRFSSSLRLRSVYLFVLVSYLCALALYMLFVFLPAILLLVFTIVGCMLLPVLLRKSLETRHLAPPEKASPERIRIGLSRTWRPVLLTAIFAFISNFTLLVSGQINVDSPLAHIISVVITLLVIIAAIIPALASPHRINLAVAYRIALPLSAAGLLVLALLWNQGGGIANSMVAMGWLLTDIVCWCIIARTTSNLRLPSFLLYGLGYAVIAFASFMGILMGFFFAGFIGSDALALMIAALIAIYIIVLAVTFLLKDRRVHGEGTSGGVNATAAKGEGASSVQSSGPITGDRVQLRVQKLSKEKGLTPRETEVLAYLAQGRNTQYMSETLYLSENTIKSHVRRIYQKLGVHSKQEVIEIINDDLSVAGDS